MHILLIHQAFAEIDEAGGTRHHEFARYLVKQGHQLTIITSPINYLTGKSNRVSFKLFCREMIEDGITINRSYAYPALHRSFLHRFFGFFSFMVSSFLAGLSVRNVDIVWGTSPPIFQGFTAWLLAFIKRAPFLFEVRDLWPAFAIAVGVLRNPLLITMSNWLEHFLYKNADRIIVNSPGFIRHVETRGGENIELIPNGADVSMFTNTVNSKNFRKQNQLEGKYIITYAGAHGFSNDLNIILEAAQLLKDNQLIQFVLIGDGKEKENLMAQADRMELNNVIFLPPVPKKEMGAYLAGSDACLAILKPLEMYKTTYPNKVFDYMAAGRPVILAIDGVIREVVEQAGAGIFVPPGDPEALALSIRYLYDNPQRRKEMGTSGQAWVQANFNRSQSAIQLNKLLINLASQKIAKRISFHL